LQGIAVTTQVLSSSGCGLLGLGEEERLGLLSLYGEEAVISVPQSVERGERFAVNFYTFGGGCTSRGRTELSTRGPEADITPYDIHSNDRICPSNVAFLDHTTWLRLDVAGAATIRVHGRVEDDRRVVREFEVLVQ
jgi:hypothetical protein